MNKALFKNILSLLMFNFGGKILGFVRDVLIANRFGASYQTDAYNIALTVPNIIFLLIGTALSTTLIPIFSEFHYKNQKEEVFNIANIILTLILILASLLVICGLLNIDIITKTLAPGFSKKTLQLTKMLVRISIFNLIFMCINSVFEALLHSMNKFKPVALSNLLISFFIIIYIFFAPSTSVQGLTLITLVSTILQSLLMLLSLIGEKFKPKVTFDILNPYISIIMRLMLPIIIGTSISQVNVLVDRSLSSTLEVGSISGLNYATKIYTLFHSVLIYPIIIVLYPALSQYSNVQDNSKFEEIIRKYISLIIFLMLPISVLLFYFSEDIVKLIFMRGNFDYQSVFLTAEALKYYSIGLMFLGLRDLLEKIWYSLKETRVPVVNSIIGISINIILNFILIKNYKIGGVALATSISIIISSFLLFIKLNNRFQMLTVKVLIAKISKVFFIILLMFSFLNFFQSQLITIFPIHNSVINMVITSIAALILYMLLLLIFERKNTINAFIQIRNKKIL